MSRRLAIAVLGVIVVLALPIAPAAQAATSVVCTSWPAPTISGSGGVITGHFYFQCNTLAGIDAIHRYSEVKRVEGNYTPPGATVSDDKTQLSAAWRTDIPVGSNHGHWYAYEALDIWGTFSFGKVPGCYRYQPNLVRCNWQSAAQFF